MPLLWWVKGLYILIQRKATFTQFWIIYPGLGINGLLSCSSLQEANQEFQPEATATFHQLSFQFHPHSTHPWMHLRRI